jgi:hypothetical protein
MSLSLLEGIILFIWLISIGDEIGRLKRRMEKMEKLVKKHGKITRE